MTYSLINSVTKVEIKLDGKWVDYTKYLTSLELIKGDKKTLPKAIHFISDEGVEMNMYLEIENEAS